MKWLQWSKINLETGLGGVETHARSLARELKALGILVEFSSKDSDLRSDEWDVIHTHGSGFTSSHSRAVSVHTLHGTTFGRMAACGEWIWPGGYLAEKKEIEGVLRSDVTLSVHPGLSLYKLARAIGKSHAVCGNGWDSASEASDPSASEARADMPASLSRLDRTRPFWLYIGRGDDVVKGADRVRELISKSKDIQLVAAPGTGFEGIKEVIQTGRLGPEQIRTLMRESHGLLVPSRYEGNSLVVLEALSLGLNVVSTRVGAAPIFPPGVQGLEILESSRPDDMLRVMKKTEGDFKNQDARRIRSEANRALLPRWRDVARISLDAVESFKRK